MRRDEITVTVDGYNKVREVTISMADLEVESYGNVFDGDPALDQLVEAIDSLSFKVSGTALPKFELEDDQ